MTMTLISTVTVGAGGAASIDFTGIPQTGKDLIILFFGRGGSGTSSTRLSLNSSTTGFTTRYLLGDGSTAISQAFGNEPYVTQDVGSNFSNAQIYIPNYTGATAKLFSVESISEDNQTAAKQLISANIWTGTAAITSLSIYGSFSGTLPQYSTASLYTISTTGATGATVA